MEYSSHLDCVRVQLETSMMCLLLDRYCLHCHSCKVRWHPSTSFLSLSRPYQPQSHPSAKKRSSYVHNATTTYLLLAPHLPNTRTMRACQSERRHPIDAGRFMTRFSWPTACWWVLRAACCCPGRASQRAADHPPSAPAHTYHYSWPPPVHCAVSE